MLKSVSPQLSPSGAGSRVIRMSPDQEQTLEAQFSRVKNPHPTDLVLLAAETGLDERDVQVIVKSKVFRDSLRLGIHIASPRGGKSKVYQPIWLPPTATKNKSVPS